MDTFESLSQFSVDPLSHSFIPRLVFLLFHLGAFAYYLMNHFISLITSPTFAILLCIVNFVLKELLLWGLFCGSLNRDSVFVYWLHLSAISSYVHSL